MVDLTNNQEMQGDMQIFFQIERKLEGISLLSEQKNFRQAAIAMNELIDIFLQDARVS
jgi:hypothetical protein